MTSKTSSKPPLKTTWQPQKVPKKRVLMLKRICKCEHAYDFVYGHRTDFHKGFAGHGVEKVQTAADQERGNQAFEIIEPWATGLRKYFTYYN
jgi:hypothetical protein